MSIGANIRKRRYELHMTQQELANIMGYKTRATIAKIESGENDVTQNKLKKFAIALDTTVEALFYGTDSYQMVSQITENEQQAADSTRNKNIVIILAGGKLGRNFQNIPNQFIDVIGKPVIVYSMETHQRHPLIDEIYVVCLKGWESIVKAYAEQFNITKLKKIISAGTYGINSIENGYEAVKDSLKKDDIIIFQESTRPMTGVELISKLIQECNDVGQANICMPMREHLQFTLYDNKQRIADREKTIEVQSPDAYKLKFLKTVFDKAHKNNHQLNESCMALLLNRLGYSINFVEGNTNNIKISKQEDIAVFTTLLKQMM